MQLPKLFETYLKIILVITSDLYQISLNIIAAVVWIRTYSKRENHRRVSITAQKMISDQNRLLFFFLIFLLVREISCMISVIFQIEAKIHTDIFVKRNERIARRIKKELDEKPNGRFFIAVGTGQLK